MSKTKWKFYINKGVSGLRIHPSLLVPSCEEQGETDVFAGLKSSASHKGGKSAQEKSHLSHHASSPPLHASLIFTCNCQRAMTT